VSKDNKSNLTAAGETSSFLKENLADFLTLSRGIISLVILSLSFIGKDAYIGVIILVLIGAATDIFDGKAARHYLGENRTGKLGKYDLAIDTLFVLCAIGYFSLSGIVIPKVAGLGWIGLALIAVVFYKRNPKILVLFEVPSVIILLITTALYNFGIFLTIIVPAMVTGITINHKRVYYLIFEYWPKIFSE